VQAWQLFRGLDRTQRATFIACFLGWALDAFDFFLLTFVILPIGKEFGRTVADVGWAIALTLMMRPVGAFLFGLLGDRFGRRRVFIIGTAWFAIASALCGLAPNVATLVAARALQGIGGALLTPGSLAIISASFTREDRPRAIGAWSGFLVVVASG